MSIMIIKQSVHFFLKLDIYIHNPLINILILLCQNCMFKINFINKMSYMSISQANKVINN